MSPRLHPCEAEGCLAWGSFGFAVPGMPRREALGNAPQARWFCGAHRALGEVLLAPPPSETMPGPLPMQGSLL